MDDMIDYFNNNTQELFQNISVLFSQKQLYVLFEPKLQCNPISDHTVPKNVFPVFEERIQQLLEAYNIKGRAKIISLFEEELAHFNLMISNNQEQVDDAMIELQRRESVLTGMRDLEPQFRQRIEEEFQHLRLELSRAMNLLYKKGIMQQQQENIPDKPMTTDNKQYKMMKERLSKTTQQNQILQLQVQKHEALIYDIKQQLQQQMQSCVLLEQKCAQLQEEIKVLTPEKIDQEIQTAYTLDIMQDIINRHLKYDELDYKLLHFNEIEEQLKQEISLLNENLSDYQTIIDKRNKVIEDYKSKLQLSEDVAKQTSLNLNQQIQKLNFQLNDVKDQFVICSKQLQEQQLQTTEMQKQQESDKQLSKQLNDQVKQLQEERRQFISTQVNMPAMQSPQAYQQKIQQLNQQLLKLQQENQLKIDEALLLQKQQLLQEFNDNLKIKNIDKQIQDGFDKLERVDMEVQTEDIQPQKMQSIRKSSCLDKSQELKNKGAKNSISGKNDMQLLKKAIKHGVQINDDDEQIDIKSVDQILEDDNNFQQIQIKTVENNEDIFEQLKLNYKNQIVRLNNVIAKFIQTNESITANQQNFCGQIEQLKQQVTQLDIFIEELDTKQSIKQQVKSQQSFIESKINSILHNIIQLPHSKLAGIKNITIDQEKQLFQTLQLKLEQLLITTGDQQIHQATQTILTSFKINQMMEKDNVQMVDECFQIRPIISVQDAYNDIQNEEATQTEFKQNDDQTQTDITIQNMKVNVQKQEKTRLNKTNNSDNINKTKTNIDTLSEQNKLKTIFNDHNPEKLDVAVFQVFNLEDSKQIIKIDNTDIQFDLQYNTELNQIFTKDNQQIGTHKWYVSVDKQQIIDQYENRISKDGFIIDKNDQVISDYKDYVYQKQKKYLQLLDKKSVVYFDNEKASAYFKRLQNAKQKILIEKLQKQEMFKATYENKFLKSDQARYNSSMAIARRELDLYKIDDLMNSKVARSNGQSGAELAYDTQLLNNYYEQKFNANDQKLNISTNMQVKSRRNSDQEYLKQQELTYNNNQSQQQKQVKQGILSQKNQQTQQKSLFRTQFQRKMQSQLANRPLTQSQINKPMLEMMSVSVLSNKNLNTSSKVIQFQ